MITAFRQWAARDPLGAGWQLSNAIAAAADDQNANELLELAANCQFGAARQMIVYALWRFRRQPQVRAALPGLCHDPDVALPASSALRRAVGNAEALPILLQIAATHPDSHVRGNAARAVRQARKRSVPESELTISPHSHSREAHASHLKYQELPVASGNSGGSASGWVSV